MREKWHGTAGGYSNHQCRCADCREAWRLKQRDYRRRNPERNNRFGKKIEK